MDKKVAKQSPRGAKSGKASNKWRDTKSRGDNRSREAETKSSFNDPSWYIADGQLAKDVASLSFNNALGAPFTVSGDVSDAKFTMPGIMTILTMPTGGASTDPNSPINIAARKVYSYVRHANSGHSNYEPADLMMYLLAMDSIYTYWSWMVRLYGTLQVFSQTNRYVGDALVSAMGANPTDLRANLANFRSYINMFAVKASTFAVPKTMTLFIRHSWMYSNIYKDTDVSKCQYYIYAPAAVYCWAPTISAGASGLQPVNVAALETTTSGGFKSITGLDNTNNTYWNIAGLGNRLIDALMSNEDIGIMSGDVLKAYGAENLWRLETIPENYAVIPVYSEEVLSQIHNTEVAPRNFCDAAGDSSGCLQNFTITQDTSIGGGTIIQDVYSAYGYHMLYDKLLDFWKQDPTPEDVLVATRNMYTVERISGSDKRLVKYTSYGSEIAVAVFIMKYDNLGMLQAAQAWESDAAAFNNIAPAYLCFNEAPIRLVVNAGGVPLTPFGEFDTYTVLSREGVRKLHESALLSMYGVPQLK